MSVTAPRAPAQAGGWIAKPGAGYGTSGPDRTTAQLQTRLRQLGFDVPTDGKYGPSTAAAVRAFQQRHKLDPTGAVDAATRELLQTPPGHPLARLRARKARSAAPTPRVAAPKKKLTRSPGKPGAAAQAPGGRPTRASTGGVQVIVKPNQGEDLEEGWVRGTGSQPSRSIKDIRPQEPAYDRPIWNAFGLRDETDLTIRDGRDRVRAVSALAEAVLARKAARTSTEFVRALARERVLRQKLAEAGFREFLHPRGRSGRWVDVIGKLKSHPSEHRGFAPGAQLPSGMRDPRIVHDVGLVDTPGQALDQRRERIRPYFDLSKPHEMVHVDSLRPTKLDPESSYQNATKRMGQAARGKLAKRKPLTAQRGAGGRLLLVDGNATLEAAKREGITHVPVEIRPRATPLDPNATHEAIAEQERLEKAAIEWEHQQRVRNIPALRRST